MSELTPREIVEELDRYIVGQKEAKKAVAIALRNRWRRRRLKSDIADEIYPKNIIMIGPTGVGKTEIARRLARLVDAPFLKVEATKFTEVGYVGRDVESMIRDLVEIAVRMVKNEKMKAVASQAQRAAKRRILDKLAPYPRQKSRKNPLQVLFTGGEADEEDISQNDEEERREIISRRRQLERELEQGLLDDEIVEIEVEDRSPRMLEILSGGGIEDMGINLQDLFGGMLPRRTKKRRVTVKEALKILEQEEAQKLIDMEEVTSLAIEKTEQSGIIFIDEIDKIAGRDNRGGPDVSREGVQRDILPIVEGSTVITKYGPVKTDYILFIAAGAFHVTKPSDLIPELQGRFPIRVELSSLSVEDFRRILTEPQNAVTKQYTALLETEGVQVSFSEDGIDELARIAYELNEKTENIGARRLHTIVEKVLEDISFDAPALAGKKIIIDRKFVQSKLQDIVQDQDLARYIL